MIHFKGLSKFLVLTAVMVFAFSCSAFAETAQVEDHGIPVIYINIDESEETIEDMNSSQDHSVKCTGTVDIKVPEGYTCCWGEGPFTDQDNLTLKFIRGRGNTTWQTDKKPYKIKFAEDQNLFGMGSDKEWALMANSFDRTMAKNLLTSWLGDQLNFPYSPKGVPVDLVMSGEKYGSKYLGCYVLSEIVNVGENRVNIDKLTKNVTATEDEAAEGEANISGGYLLSVYDENQDSDEPEENVFITEQGTPWLHQYPEYDYTIPTEGQQKQQEYIQGYMQKLENLIMENPIDHDAVSAMMDLQSAADYWLIQEFSLDGDAFQTHSTYVYKPRGGKLYWGPLWDFDSGWEPDLMEEADNTYNSTKMLWLDRLRAYDPSFRQLIKERWAILKAGLLDATDEGGILDQYRQELDEAWKADQTLWPEYTYSDDQTYKEIMDELKTAIRNRVNAFDNNMDTELGNVYITVHFVAEGREVDLYNDVRLTDKPSETPDAPEKEGYVFAGWFEEETGESFYEIQFDQDLTFIAKYIPESEAVVPVGLFFQKCEDWIPLQDGETAIPDMRTSPKKGITNYRIKFTSSDESIASFYGDLIKLHRTGDVVITATMYNGVSASMTVHVYDEDKVQKTTPESIQFKESSFTMKKGEERQAQYTLLPSDVPLDYQYIDYESSNATIASVDWFGVITAKKPGTATISYTVYDSDDRECCNGSCKVTVKEDSTEAAKTTTKKVANTMKAKGKTVKIKAAKLKKKARVIKRKKAITVTKARGKVTYKLLKGNKKKFKVAPRTGKIKLKKGLKKGTYKLKIKVTAAGNSKYKAKSKVVKVIIRVK